MNEMGTLVSLINEIVPVWALGSHFGRPSVHNWDNRDSTAPYTYETSSPHNQLQGPTAARMTEEHTFQPGVYARYKHRIHIYLKTNAINTRYQILRSDIKIKIALEGGIHGGHHGLLTTNDWGRNCRSVHIQHDTVCRHTIINHCLTRLTEVWMSLINQHNKSYKRPSHLTSKTLIIDWRRKDGRDCEWIQSGIWCGSWYGCWKTWQIGNGDGLGGSYIGTPAKIVTFTWIRWNIEGE